MIKKFERVIWVTVSEGRYYEEVQDQILEAIMEMPMPFEGEIYLSREQKAWTLEEFLMDNKILMILDDVWEKLDLELLGVPLFPAGEHRYKSKVIISTRTENVCTDMMCDARVYVPGLDAEESWKLFRSKVRTAEGMDSVDIPTSSPDVAELISQCAGLPLAISIVGATMARKRKRKEDWGKAGRRLKQSISSIPNTEEHILACLKVGFDGLESWIEQSCLLYCCMYPKGYEIRREDLVEQWIGEGFLEKSLVVNVGTSVSSKHIGDIDLFRLEGYRIIRTLEDACLLEAVTENDVGYDVSVKVHDSVREMGLWIMSLEDIHGMGKYIVHTRVDVSGELEIPRATERISLIESNIDGSFKPSARSYPRLKTLLLRGAEISVPDALENTLSSSPFIKVLDLSWCKDRLRLKPMHEWAVSDIFSRKLFASIGMLSNLRYLNFRGTPITNLPQEIGNLKKLNILDLGDTNFLQQIDKEAICKLSSLEKLNLERSIFDWFYTLKLADLGRLSRLKDLRMNRLYTAEALKECTQAVSKSIVSLDLCYMEALNVDELSAAVEEMEKLKELILRQIYCLTGTWVIHGCDGGFLALRSIHIDGCAGLTYIAGLSMLPRLEKLVLQYCYHLKVVAREEVNATEAAFPSLKYLQLHCLPSLTRISICQFRWPSLRVLHVIHCASLRESPFGRHSAPQMTRIIGSRFWWDQLEWASEDIESRFATCLNEPYRYGNRQRRV